MTLQKKLVTAIATGAVLLNSMAPLALADTTIQISGNGTDSDNTANVQTNQSTTVVQNNDAYVSNNVDVDANTGGNKAEDNTGGDVEIETGDADVDVAVSNLLNKNTASVDCCQTGDTEVLIAGNGKDSDNKADLDFNNDTSVYQDNNAHVDNDVYVDSTTGDNEAEGNTGGDVKINTGDADATVKVSTVANANSAIVGNGNGDGGDLTLRILGNGTDSDNDIYLDVNAATVVSQDNDARVYNDVDVDATTGDNKAEDNTGGDVIIETGDADVYAEVDNMVNFNWADVNCGCLFDDILAKIDGNGKDSDNKIDADLNFNNGKEEGTFQDNYAKLDNDLDELDADTGYNKNDDNTAYGYSDPSIKTGDADIDAKVNNTGNVNVVGEDAPELPELDLDFNLDLDDLWALLHLLH